MFEHDYEIKANALEMWANYIETGDSCRSKKTCIQMGAESQIKKLDSNQLVLVARIRRLQEDELKAGAKLTMSEVESTRKQPVNLSHGIRKANGLKF